MSIGYNPTLRSQAAQVAGYLRTHLRSGIKPGDCVAVLRKAKSGEQGWDNSWTYLMDAYVGKILKVREDDGCRGFVLEPPKELGDCTAGLGFPSFVLVKVIPPEEQETFSDTQILTVLRRSVERREGAIRHAERMGRRLDRTHQREEFVFDTRVLRYLLDQLSQ